MANRNNVAAEDETISAAPAPDTTQEDLGRIRALAEWRTKDLPPQIAADTVMKMLGDLASGAIKDSAAQREVLDVLMRRAVQLEQSEPNPDEAEALALLDSFESRITEVERRIDRVLARLDAG